MAKQHPGVKAFSPAGKVHPGLKAANSASRPKHGTGPVQRVMQQPASALAPTAPIGPPQMPAANIPGPNQGN